MLLGSECIVFPKWKPLRVDLIVKTFTIKIEFNYYYFQIFIYYIISISSLFFLNKENLVVILLIVHAIAWSLSKLRPDSNILVISWNQLSLLTT
jgi:hypothetical protein